MIAGQNAELIKVEIEGLGTCHCSVGTEISSLLESRVAASGAPYLAALVNNDVVSLSYALEVDSKVRLLTRESSPGWHVYRRSLAMLLAKATKDVFPLARLYIEHSLGTGFYCTLELDGQTSVRPEQLAAIEARMRELVKAGTPIQRKKIFFVEALRRFEELGAWDKCNLLRYRNPPKVVVHTCEDFLELSHGPLANNAEQLVPFELIPYPPGFILNFCKPALEEEQQPWETLRQLFNIFREHKEWGRTVGVRNVGDLNVLVNDGGFDGFVRIAEAYQEKRIATLADQIYARRHKVRWVLIAGPSSSGKTTFAKRLAVQLQVNGLKPLVISVDNYFVDREKTPRDEAGNYDFEHLEALDLPLLHEHLRLLDNGEEVQLPKFAFAKGRRDGFGEKIRIAEGQLVILEGIHSLNPALAATIPAEHKFKIYISAVTQLNLDDHNRISTTDNRLLRRLVRDHRFRGNSALMTLQLWPNVRKGEKRWIFPYQHEADATFNSALDYELAVLKPMVEPLLAEVKPYHHQYADARRLQAFMAEFVAASTSAVPSTSILREFVGQSGFVY